MASFQLPSLFGPSVEDRIGKFASMFGQDPNLMREIIRQESGGRSTAVNPRTGATGFMQLMPNTAREPGFGVTPFDPSKSLDDPDENLRLGIQYASALIKEYDGVVEYGLAAYNWGKGNVDKWIAAGANPADLPDETRQYVRNIVSNRRKYDAAGELPAATPQAASSPAATPVAAALRERPKKDLPMPTGMQRVGDEIEWAAKALYSGAIDTVSLLTDMVDLGFGRDDLTDQAATALEDHANRVRESIPEWMKESLQKDILHYDENGDIDFDMPSFRQVANLALESVGPGGAIFKGGKLALSGLGKIKKLERLMKLHPRFATAASIGGANATYISADTYRSVYKTVFEDAKGEGMSDEDAHAEARNSAIFGASIIAPIAFATGGLGEGLAATGSTFMKRLAQGLVGGAATEAPEEGSQYIAEQLGTGRPIDTTELGERALLGAFGAGPMEGVIAATLGADPNEMAANEIERARLAAEKARLATPPASPAPLDEPPGGGGGGGAAPEIPLVESGPDGPAPAPPAAVAGAVEMDASLPDVPVPAPVSNVATQEETSPPVALTALGEALQKARADAAARVGELPVAQRESPPPITPPAPAPLAALDEEVAAKKIEAAAPSLISEERDSARGRTTVRELDPVDGVRQVQVTFTPGQKGTTTDTGQSLFVAHPSRPAQTWTVDANGVITPAEGTTTTLSAPLQRELIDRLNNKQPKTPGRKAAKVTPVETPTTEPVAAAPVDPLQASTRTELEGKKAEQLKKLIDKANNELKAAGRPTLKKGKKGAMVETLMGHLFPVKTVEEQVTEAAAAPVEPAKPAKRVKLKAAAQAVAAEPAPAPKQETKEAKKVRERRAEKPVMKPAPLPEPTVAPTPAPKPAKPVQRSVEQLVRPAHDFDESGYYDVQMPSGKVEQMVETKLAESEGGGSEWRDAYTDDLLGTSKEEAYETLRKADAKQAATAAPVTVIYPEGAAPDVSAEPVAEPVAEPAASPKIATAAELEEQAYQLRRSEMQEKLRNMTAQELKKHLQYAGMKATGTKSVLLERALGAIPETNPVPQHTAEPAAAPVAPAAPVAAPVTKEAQKKAGGKKAGKKKVSKKAAAKPAEPVAEPAPATKTADEMFAELAAKVEAAQAAAAEKKAAAEAQANTPMKTSAALRSVSELLNKLVAKAGVPKSQMGVIRDGKATPDVAAETSLSIDEHVDRALEEGTIKKGEAKQLHDALKAYRAELAAHAGRELVTLPRETAEQKAKRGKKDTVVEVPETEATEGVLATPMPDHVKVTDDEGGTKSPEKAENHDPTRAHGPTAKQRAAKPVVESLNPEDQQAEQEWDDANTEQPAGEDPVRPSEVAEDKPKKKKRQTAAERTAEKRAQARMDAKRRKAIAEARDAEAAAEKSMWEERHGMPATPENRRMVAEAQTRFKDTLDKLVETTTGSWRAVGKHIMGGRNNGGGKGPWTSAGYWQEFNKLFAAARGRTRRWLVERLIDRHYSIRLIQQMLSEDAGSPDGKMIKGIVSDPLRVWESFSLAGSKIDVAIKQMMDKYNNPISHIAAGHNADGTVHADWASIPWSVVNEFKALIHAIHRNDYMQRKRSKNKYKAPMAEDVLGEGGISKADAKARLTELESIYPKDQLYALEDAVTTLASHFRDTLKTTGLITSETFRNWKGNAQLFAEYQRVREAKGLAAANDIANYTAWLATATMAPHEWAAFMHNNTYVPLLSIKDAGIAEAYLNTIVQEEGYFSEADLYGDELRQAHGRDTVATDAVTHLLQNQCQAIIHSIKNEQIGFSVYNMAKKLMSLGGNQLMVAVDTNLDGTPLEAGDLSDPTKARDLWQHYHPGLKNANALTISRRLGEKGGPYIFRQKRGDTETAVLIYDASLAAALMNTQTSEALDKLFHYIGMPAKIVRKMFTSWNPAFVPVNFLREVANARIQARSIALPADIPEADRKEMEQALTKSINFISGGQWAKSYWRELRDPKADLSLITDPKERHRRERVRSLRAAGMHAAFHQMRTAQDLQAEFVKVRSALEKMKSGNPLTRLGMFRRVASIMDDLSDASENGVRVAVASELYTQLDAYYAKKFPNLSPAEREAKSAEAMNIAASEGQNLSVNFQRFGTWGSRINTLYFFYNPSIQGLYRSYQALRHPGVRKIVMGIGVAGLAQTILNHALGGDDDDDRSKYETKVPDWVKETNMVIMNPFSEEGDYFTMPLPYIYNIPFFVGEQVMSMFMGADDRRESMEEAIQRAAPKLFNMVVANLSPIRSSSFTRGAVPSMVVPFYDVAVNESWMGTRINPNNVTIGSAPVPDAYNLRDPDDKEVWQFLAKMVSTSGEFEQGAIDVSPYTLEYLTKYFTGGAGTFIPRLYESAALLMGGEVREAAGAMPIVRRFFGLGEGQYEDKDRYYSLKTRYDLLLEERKTLIERRGSDPEGLQLFLEYEGYNWGSGTAQRYKSTEKRIAKLSRQRNALRKIEGKTEFQKDRVEALDLRILDLMQKFNLYYYENIAMKEQF